MTKRNGTWMRKAFDLIMPRACIACGDRLTTTERYLCANCSRHLPRTFYELTPSSNAMTDCFMHLLSLEKCVALLYHHPSNESAQMVYAMKYSRQRKIGIWLGELLAKEIKDAGFFDGIDVIVPIPLTRSREEERGYNQSLLLAEGITHHVAIPIANDAVERVTFRGSQTQKDRWERNQNVHESFKLKNPNLLKGKNVLIIDDVVTTGATVIACGNEILKAAPRSISLLALSFAGSQM